MTIKTTQKLINIGTSKGVTLPAKELKKLGVKEGQELEITAKLADNTPNEKVEFVELTQKLIKRHQKALKNLSQR